MFELFNLKCPDRQAFRLVKCSVLLCKYYLALQNAQIRNARMSYLLKETVIVLCSYIKSNAYLLDETVTAVNYSCNSYLEIASRHKNCFCLYPLIKYEQLL